MCETSSALPTTDIHYASWMFDKRGLGLRLDSPALPLYAAIYAASRPDANGNPVGSWHQSLNTFAKEMGFSRRTVTAAIAELVGRGLVDMLGLTTYPTDNANIRVYRVNPHAALEAERRRAVALVGQEELPEPGARHLDEATCDAESSTADNVAQVPPSQQPAAPSPSWEEGRPVSPAPEQALPKQDPDFDRWYKMYPREDNNPSYRSSTMRSYELLKREGWSADQIEAATLAAIQDYRSRNDRPESGPDYWMYMRYPVRFLNEDIRDFLPREKAAQDESPESAPPHERGLTQGADRNGAAAPTQPASAASDSKTVTRKPVLAAEDLISRVPLQMFKERGRTTAIATVQVPWRTDLWGSALYPTKTLVVSALVGEGASRDEALAALTRELRRMLGEKVEDEPGEGEADE